MKACPVNSTLTALNHLKNLFKSTIAAIALSVIALYSLPLEAKVDNGTLDLINTVEQLGFKVHINSKLCNRGFAGLFIPSEQTIHLCKGKGIATADEHDTVRHEVFHVIQYCGTPKGAGRLHPYSKDKESFIDLINVSLTKSQITHVLDAYPSRHEAVELEAFAAAQVLSASEIQDILVQECS